MGPGLASLLPKQAQISNPSQREVTVAEHKTRYYRLPSMVHCNSSHWGGGGGR